MYVSFPILIAFASVLSIALESNSRDGRRLLPSFVGYLWNDVEVYAVDLFRLRDQIHWDFRYHCVSSRAKWRLKREPAIASLEAPRSGPLGYPVEAVPFTTLG